MIFLHNKVENPNSYSGRLSMRINVNSYELKEIYRNGRGSGYKTFERQTRTFVKLNNKADLR
jgi:hypothetical protein